MHLSHLQHPPYPSPYLFILGLIFLAAIALIELNVLRYAYERIGLTRGMAYLVLIVSLFGSTINIPVVELRPEHVQSDVIVEDPFGFPRVVPQADTGQGTIIAINLGGAIVPICLSVYLIFRNGIYVRSAIGVAIVAFIVHLLARPLPGVGITVPVFIPPIAAAIVALVISRVPLPEQGTVTTPPSLTLLPALAYVSGCMGTLIGADLLNLGSIGSLGAPVASIGGAGTFDGVFLTGIIAVLLA